MTLLNIMFSVLHVKANFPGITKGIRREMKYRPGAESLANTMAEDLVKCNAWWHLTCYKKCTHKLNLARLKKCIGHQEKGEDAGTYASCRQDMPYIRSHGMHFENTFYWDNPEAPKCPLSTVLT